MGVFVVVFMVCRLQVISSKVFGLMLCHFCYTKEHNLLSYWRFLIRVTLKMKTDYKDYKDYQDKINQIRKLKTAMIDQRINTFWKKKSK